MSHHTPILGRWVPSAPRRSKSTTEITTTRTRKCARWPSQDHRRRIEMPGNPRAIVQEAELSFPSGSSSRCQRPGSAPAICQWRTGSMSTAVSMAGRSRPPARVGCSTMLSQFTLTHRPVRWPSSPGGWSRATIRSASTSCARMSRGNECRYQRIRRRSNCAASAVDASGRRLVQRCLALANVFLRVACPICACQEMAQKGACQKAAIGQHQTTHCILA